MAVTATLLALSEAARQAKQGLVGSRPATATPEQGRFDPHRFPADECPAGRAAAAVRCQELSRPATGAKTEPTSDLACADLIDGLGFVAV